MFTFFSALFYYFLPIWVILIVLISMTILFSIGRKHPENSFLNRAALKSQDLFVSEKRSTHYFRAFILITALSYWLSKDAPELI